MQRDKSLFFLLFLFFSLICFSCKRKSEEVVIVPDALKNHLQNARILGNVNCIETDTYFYSNKDSCFVFTNRTIQYFNADGFLTQVIELDKNRDTVSKKNVYYLTNTQENYWEEFNYKENSVTKDTFIYDRNGYKAEERFMLNDSLLYRIEYKTDGIGGIIEMKRVLPEYHLINKIYYNENGLVARIEEYDPHNKLYKYFTIEYDNHGNEINRRAFKSNNEIIEFTYSQYNNEGWLQKVIFEDQLYNLREDRIFTHHDNFGNWLEEMVMQVKDTMGKRVRHLVIRWWIIPLQFIEGVDGEAGRGS